MNKDVAFCFEAVLLNELLKSVILGVGYIVQGLHLLLKEFERVFEVPLLSTDQLEN